MISESYRYYGSAIFSIIQVSPEKLEISRIVEAPAGFFLINNRVPIYIKYSKSRKGPWVFNFQKDHQVCQQNIYDTYGECLILFVCGKDGIPTLDHKDFRKILDNHFEEQESVSIKRRHNKLYQVNGRDGRLERKISRNSLEEIFRKLLQG